MQTYYCWIPGDRAWRADHAPYEAWAKLGSTTPIGPTTDPKAIAHKTPSSDAPHGWVLLVADDGVADGAVAGVEPEAALRSAGEELARRKSPANQLASHPIWGVDGRALAHQQLLDARLSLIEKKPLMAWSVYQRRPCRPAKASGMWPLRQPNGDDTRQPSSVRTDGGFLHVSEHHSSAAR